MHAQRAIGIIGLGLAGSALAERLLHQGFAIVAHDLVPERRQAAARIGARAVDAPRLAAGAGDRLILSLPDSHVVGEVLAIVADSMPPGQVILDTTTGDPDDAPRFAAAIEPRGVTYLDCPIAGSSHQVRQGEAVALVGGPAEGVAAAQDVFEALFARTLHVGPSGSGARFKLVHNLVLGLHRAVLAEAITLARAIGLDGERALDVLRQTPARSAVMEIKGRKMLEGDFTPQATVAQHAKDVRLMLELAQRHRIDLPLSRVHNELLDRLIAAGLGGADNAAIIAAFDPTSPRRD